MKAGFAGQGVAIMSSKAVVRWTVIKTEVRLKQILKATE